MDVVRQAMADANAAYRDAMARGNGSQAQVCVHAHLSVVPKVQTRCGKCCMLAPPFFRLPVLPACASCEIISCTCQLLESWGSASQLKDKGTGIAASCAQKRSVSWCTSLWVCFGGPCRVLVGPGPGTIRNVFVHPGAGVPGEAYLGTSRPCGNAASSGGRKKGKDWQATQP
eukprot:1150868-Pelagomonas_calceolata.AAC.4